MDRVMPEIGTDSLLIYAIDETTSTQAAMLACLKIDFKVTGR